MAAPVLQFKRGLFNNLPGLRAGEPGFTTDRYDLYVGLTSETATNKFVGSSRFWRVETESTGSAVNLVEGSSNGSDYISLAAPASLAGIVTYTFPGTQGAVSSVLTNDGNGNLTWGAGSANSALTGITTIQGHLNIEASTDISGITTVTNTTDNTLGDENTGSVQLDGGMGIAKNLTVKQNLHVGGYSEFVGVVTFRGGTINLGDSGSDDVIVGGEFASDLIPTTDVYYDLGSLSNRWADIYARSLNLSENLNVTGFSTFNGIVVGNNGINVAGFSTIYNLHILDDLFVNGIFEVDESFASHGNSVLSGIVSFTGTTESTSYDNGAVIIDGGVGIQRNLNVGGDINVSGNVTIGGTFVALRGQDVFIENKDIILGYTTSITPNEDTANHAGVAIASTEGSPLVSFAASGINTLPDTYKQLMWFKSGTLGFETDAFAFNYALAIGTTSMANGVVLAVGSGVTASNNSVSATNFYASGGVQGDLTGNVSGNINSTGVSTIANLSATDVVIGAGLTVTGAIDGNGAGALQDSGNLTFDGSTLTVTGDLSVTDSIAVTKDAVVGAGLTVTGAVDFNGGLNVSGAETVLSSATVSDLTSGRVVLAGTSGAIEDSGNLTFNGTTLTVTGAAAVDNVTIDGNTVSTSSGGLTLDSTGGTVTVADDLTVNGNFTVLGTQSIINTETLKVEDSLIEVGLVNSGGSLVAPSSDANIDVGIVLHYYSGSAKTAAMFWDDSAGRIVVASQVTETTSVMGSITYADFEIGSLWVNDCAGQSQVISCSGSTRSLENITIDGGSF